MKPNPLKIVTTEENHPTSNQSNWRNALRAKFERLWLVDPEQFNPNKNVKEQERVNRTLILIKKYFNHFKDKKIADIGCGYGILTNQCLQAGGFVTALDIAQNALKRLESSTPNLKLIQSCLPSTILPDAEFDLVICTDVIAYLPPQQFRLFFSELARLLKPNGILICSTPIDIQTDNGIERFAQLAETEFTIIEWKISFHALWMRLEKLLPKGIKNKFNKSKRSLSLMESLSRFFLSENGISHAIFAARIKPLFKAIPQTEQSQLRPTKKQLWE